MDRKAYSGRLEGWTVAHWLAGVYPIFAEHRNQAICMFLEQYTRYNWELDPDGVCPTSVGSRKLTDFQKSVWEREKPVHKAVRVHLKTHEINCAQGSTA